MKPCPLCAGRLRQTFSMAMDVLMPGGVRQNTGKGDGSLEKSYRSGGITLGEMQRCARNVLNLCKKLNQP